MSQPSTSETIVPIKRKDYRGAIRERIQEAIGEILEEELQAALGASWYERVERRCGHRNGHEEREVVTANGPVTLRVPRGRLFEEDGTSREWRSDLIPRYQRRIREVNEAILGCYFGGVNTRRIRRSLKPLLGDQFLSKSAISRLVTRLRKLFERWRERDLSEEKVLIVYLDAMRLPVRLARRVVKVPVQASVGVLEDGRKVLLSLEIAASESNASWELVVRDLAERELACPRLVIVDGNRGLSNAIRSHWKDALVQRCTRHKLENLLSKAPKHCHAELTRDYRSIVDATDLAAAEEARAAFVAKWSSLSREVVRSLEEAGDELLTFYRFPQSMWKCLRTTNPIERVNQEFRRRTKTQGSFPNEDAALVLLFGLVAMGQIQLRRIDGWRDLPYVLAMGAGVRGLAEAA
jgi:transposase-like protein